MYRIELAPGEETALRNAEELAIGIRNGVITARARIWHNTGQKWLPIEMHPHYRAVIEQQAKAGAKSSTAPSAASSSVLTASSVSTEIPGRALETASRELETASHEIPFPPKPVGRPSPFRLASLLIGGLALVAGTWTALSAWEATAVVAPASAMTMAVPTGEASMSAEPQGEQSETASDSPQAIKSAMAANTTLSQSEPGGAVVRGPREIAPAPATSEIAPARPPAPVIPPAPEIEPLPLPSFVDVPLAEPAVPAPAEARAQASTP